GNGAQPRVTRQCLGGRRWRLIFRLRLVGSPLMEVLAGDVGGTKTLLAIAEVGEAKGSVEGPPIVLGESRRYDSRKHPGLASICHAFAAELGRPLPAHAGFGVAGPVSGGRSHTTNLPWVLEENDLRSALGLGSIRLVNDFHA